MEQQDILKRLNPVSSKNGVSTPAEFLYLFSLRYSNIYIEPDFSPSLYEK